MVFSSQALCTPTIAIHDEYICYVLAISHGPRSLNFSDTICSYIMENKGFELLPQILEDEMSAWLKGFKQCLWLYPYESLAGCVA